MVWTFGWLSALRAVVQDLTGIVIYLPDPPGQDRWGVWSVVARWVRGEWRRTLAGDCDDFAAELLRRLLKAGRSEEHTSELQSLMRISYAVFGLQKTNNK